MSKVMLEVSTLMHTFLKPPTLDCNERYVKNLVASMTRLRRFNNLLPILAAIATHLVKGILEAHQMRSKQGRNLEAIALKHAIMIAHT